MYIDRLIDSDFEDSEETMWDNWHHYASRIRSWRIWVLSWWHMCSWAKTGCYRNLQSGGIPTGTWKPQKNRDSTPKFESSSRTDEGDQVSKLRIQWLTKIDREITQTIICFGMLLFPSSTWLEHPSGPPFHRCTWPAKMDGYNACLFAYGQTGAESVCWEHPTCWAWLKVINSKFLSVDTQTHQMWRSIVVYIFLTTWLGHSRSLLNRTNPSRARTVFALASL